MSQQNDTARYQNATFHVQVGDVITCKKGILLKSYLGGGERFYNVKKFKIIDFTSSGAILIEAIDKAPIDVNAVSDTPEILS